MNFKVYEGTKCDTTDMIYRLQYTCTCSLDIAAPFSGAVSALFLGNFTPAFLGHIPPTPNHYMCALNLKVIIDNTHRLLTC